MIVAPMAIAHLIEEYGWRGSVLIEAALMANMIPLAWTFVDPPSPTRAAPPAMKRKSVHGKDKPEIDEFVKDKCHQLLDKTSSSEGSLNRTEEASSSTLCHFIKSAFDFSMLRDSLFLLYCLSNFLTRVNSSTIITHLPSFCVTEGFSMDQAALIASVAGGWNVAARFAASFMSSYPDLNHLVVYGVVMVMNSGASVMLLTMPGLAGKCVAASFFGFAFGESVVFLLAQLNACIVTLV